jgi:hypothetical protein
MAAKKAMKEWRQNWIKFVIRPHALMEEVSVKKNKVSVCWPCLAKLPLTLTGYCDECAGLKIHMHKMNGLNTYVMFRQEIIVTMRTRTLLVSSKLGLKLEFLRMSCDQAPHFKIFEPMHSRR